MNNKSLKGWNYTPDMDMLVFFANLVDELSFNYTIDSFKAPAMNVISMVKECKDVIRQIDAGIINSSNLSSVLEELRYVMKEDTTFSEVLEAKGLVYLKNGVLDTAYESELSNTLDLLSLAYLSKPYIEKLKSKITELVKQNSKKKEEVVDYTRKLITQLLNEGYSDEYIYSTNLSFFFSSTSEINSVSDIDDYFSFFDCNNKAFKSYHVCNPYFDGLKQSFNLKGYDIVEPADSGLDQKKDIVANFYKQASPTSKIIITTIEAKDEFSAREKSQEAIDEIVRFFRFYRHHGKPEIKKICLISNMTTGDLYRITPPIPHILRTKDLKQKKAEIKFKYHYRKVHFCEESMQRINKSLDLHKAALEADSMENQFINLFTAFEVLIPKQPEAQKPRIVQIYDNLVPYLSVHYYKKLINSVLRDLYQWNTPSIKAILAQVNEGTENIEKLTALIVLGKYYDEQNNAPLNQLYSQLDNDKFFLMRNRMYRLYQILHKHESILDFLTIHEQRLKWHVDRIYRTRNLIVHAGTSPDYLGTILENLHSYYDILINQLIEDNISFKYRSIQNSYTTCLLKVEEYKKYLADNKKIEVDETNLLKAVFDK